MSLPLLLLGGFVASALAPRLCKTLPRLGALLLAIWPLAFAAHLFRLAPDILAGKPFEHAIEWAPALGISLSFYVDELSLLFGLMVSLVGVVVMVYAASYLKGHAYLGRFYAMLLMFMTAMNAVVCSGNVISLFIAWELTGISSYLLIGFKHDKEVPRAAALQALLITTAGGLALLAGLVMVGSIAGTYELRELLANGDLIRNHDLYGWILVLILLGAFTKSAQFPFHFWLPRAMEAPTPISAYLHSATMVKLGVFLLARFYPMLAGTPEWTALLTFFGGVTMVMGALRSPFQDDLKAVLAYSTLSVLGMLTFLLGLGGKVALKAVVLVTIAHALYKAPLFLVAGTVDHATGTRSVRSLSGLRTKMPWTFATGLIAGLSMLGAPPLLGFVAKETLLDASLASAYPIPTTTAAAITGIGLMAAAWVAGIKPFLGEPSTAAQRAHGVSPGFWLGPLLLASLGLVFGLVTALVAPWTLGATAAIQGAPAAFKVALWHGFTPALATSGIVLALGTGLIALRDLLKDRLDRIEWRGLPRPSTLYQQGYEAMFVVARGLTDRTQSDSLRDNLSTILFAFLLLGGYTLYRLGGLPSPPTVELHWLEVGLGSILLAASFAAIRARSMLNAALMLGVVGFAMSAVFLVYGAVDLAITQIVVDTLTVLLFVLVVHKLPRFARLSTKKTMIRDAILASLAGIFMTFLVLKAHQVNVHEPISGFFAEKAVPEAFGRNIVNVILVDFRALDTLGEITVLMAGALGVYLLVRSGEAKAKPREVQGT